eukprot:TRINITY_DN2744_c0_g2_i11.p1 TRINITY_DN2744_c0_g2~~TRINITY_DN2744_c0_g2_i11.p1  ORF type:complete len:228 (-),score=49.94 TRINITY_DN2744_c0_g2_i11:749-1432(-)
MSYSYLFKLILIGDSAVGKSCMLLQYLSSQFHTKHEVTIGVEYGTKMTTCSGKNIRLQIWDTAGCETFKSITRSYYRGVAGVIVAFDLSNAETFEHVGEWINELKEATTVSVTTLLVGNKSDLSEREVSSERAMDFAKENGLTYIETSAKTGTNINEAFSEITKQIHSKIVDGLLDPTQESSGVRLGTDIEASEYLADKGQKLAPNNSWDSCINCCCLIASIRYSKS